jgi:hypothetical protein
VNRLAPAGEDRWRLATHAHLVVYEAVDGGELLTVYDCGASQAPPRAQVVGHLVRVDAAHERTPQPTGYIVTLREPAALVRQPGDGIDHYVVRSAERSEADRRANGEPSDP